jgi:hypothetical protein
MDLDKKEFQLLDVIIRDKSGNENPDFVALNILHALPCLDRKKSVFDIDEDHYYEGVSKVQSLSEKVIDCNLS